MTRSATFPIVGIGASAGGIQALEGFFKGIRADTSAAFVIVTHLSPTRESLLHEVIAHYTPLPILVAESGMAVKRDHVYVMPANVVMTIANGILHFRPREGGHRDRYPVDIFLVSLAVDQSEQAIGVILSGGDADGTVGVRAIKEHGGLTFAQVADGSAPQLAGMHTGMPNSAIASGLVDFALPAEAMGEQLARFSGHLAIADIIEGNEEREIADACQLIYGILKEQAGHDFSGYKNKTFLRRVRRRMQLSQTATLAGYVQRLKQDPAETDLLFRDLLINVTAFFRDAEAFAALEKALPKMFEDSTAAETIRAWVPGCATGEEVYSIAILLQEQAEQMATSPRLQIFATDVDQEALAVARAARYTEAAMESLTPERRTRFFTKTGNTYVLKKQLRDSCIFSPHSVIHEPPFSRMNLISCRNLLIYFDTEAQSQVIPTFHYALKPGGYLFLGISENISQYGHLFAPIDKKQRLFQRRDLTPATTKLPMSLSILRPTASSDIAPLRKARTDRISVSSLRQSIEALVLNRHAPAHVLVNGDGDIVYYSARTGKYLEQTQGMPNRQLLTMARKGLHLDLRSCLREAVETGRMAMRDSAVVDADNQVLHLVKLRIEPFNDRGQEPGLFLVLFSDTGDVADPEDPDHQLRHNASDTVADLERDLRESKDRAQAMAEEYETALEELKTSNEELVSVNEEMQSTHEELEASKEELQSMNEEMNTINLELSKKVDDLDLANSDLRNLFNSTQVATVFLDADLIIRSFTPGASTIFRLKSIDIGRPLADFASNLNYPDFYKQIEEVLRTGEIIEHQVSRLDLEVHYLARLIPYRTADMAISGVVITFIEITRLKEEEQQQVMISELNHRVKNMLAVIISITSLTFKRATSPQAFYEALIGRMHAMGRSYELLSRENWVAAPLSQLLSQELSMFDRDRMSWTGPNVELQPKPALAIGMIVHELATNAAKYGALARNDGHINIQWSLSGDYSNRRLAFSWREISTTPVTKPQKNGFGLTLVEREVLHSLGGAVSIEFKPEGLAIELAFDLHQPGAFQDMVAIPV